jgi:hypothetical protein
MLMKLVATPRSPMNMHFERLRSQTPDLTCHAPRSPYVALSREFPAVAARLLDKCRAELLGRNGDYHYDCPMDRQFLTATGLEAEALREFVATGADDNEVAAWMSANAKAPADQIISWGHRFRRNPLWILLKFEDWLHQRRQRKATGVAPVT